jgi:glucose 1-dehydrogenase
MDAPDFRMDGKVALLTGAGRGIGLAIARAFVAQGAAVAIQDIDQDVAAREVEQIRKEGGRAVALGGDVTDASLPPRLVQQTVEQLGGLHILVNNAAIQSYADWATLGEDVIERQLRGDLVAPILMCQQVVPIFRRQHFGRILNIGSIQQTTGNPKMLPYSLSKAALEKMTTALAIDLAKDNITVNCIAPGYFNTYRNREQFKTAEEVERKGKQIVPLGWIGRPEDCAGLAVLLCSKAGEYITGQSVLVDGGMSLR